MLRNAKAWLVVLGCTSAVILLEAIVLAAPPNEPPALQVVHRFGEQYLMLYMERTTGIEGQNQTEVIENAELIKLGERYFIRGKGTLALQYLEDKKWSWYNGINVAFDWASVVQYCELNPEQFQAYQESLLAEE